jgi:sugar phosphate isomerase/epimerase
MQLLPAPVSISIAGLSADAERPWSGSVRQAIAWVAGLGARSIQLDGTTTTLRARELDRSARRDLAASIRRAGLLLSGIDLWIPATHFVDAAHQDRAAAAVVGAIDLAGELTALGIGSGSLMVCIRTGKEAPAEVVASMSGAAERAGVVLADHALPSAEGTPIGIDPAMVLLGGGDPIAAVVTADARLGSARLSDAGGAGRVPVGSRDGQLDVLAYAGALSVVGYGRSLIVDLRGLGDEQDRAARDTLLLVDRD